jgi:hypothetical protein
MSDPPEHDRVEIRAEIAGLEGLGGESFWAEPLGDDLYRLDTIPFYAYDIHYRDVVRAVPQEPGAMPTVIEVVRPSGHKTLRVMFEARLSPEEVEHLLESLAGRGVQIERSPDHFYALNVPPDRDYQGICTLLWTQENAGWLNYETGTTAS